MINTDGKIFDEPIVPSCTLIAKGKLKKKPRIFKSALNQVWKFMMKKIIGEKKKNNNELVSRLIALRTQGTALR